MLDTRVVARDRQAPRAEVALIDDPRRSLLGETQEQWLFGELRQSRKREARWQLIGQQVMFAPTSQRGQPAVNADSWDGYRPARERVVDFLESNGMKNAVILTGDVHSSWAYDVPKDPWGTYDAASGKGTTAIELVTPSITSPSGWTADTAADRLRRMKEARPHLHWADGLSHGYIVLSVEKDAVQSDWFGVPTIEERTAREYFVKGFTSEHDHPHLIEAASPAPSA